RPDARCGCAGACGVIGDSATEGTASEAGDGGGGSAEEIVGEQARGGGNVESGVERPVKSVSGDAVCGRSIGGREGRSGDCATDEGLVEHGRSRVGDDGAQEV